MAATPINVSDKFIHPGITVVLFVPTIADPAAPTRVELDAGTDLTEEVIAAGGWQLNSNRVSYNPLGSKFTPNIAGRQSVDDSSLTLPQDLAGDDVRSVLPQGTTGYIVIMHGGDVAASPMDVWPVEVSSLGKPVLPEGSEIASIAVQFAIPSEPAESVAIPA
ncbi:hypothetical protein CDO52_12975 [Nocardiopsis gilva YIM 90087]|uniref:Uncharacterized protein n=1 Tax=Nocardiopsis gilva YIM 90087 TaxID=1235441 RepID=A0A223S653_9ACTN|nr:hypothetical protein [Nocardiopsis gilva]ASU83582.1 hypothetical protein CDO52_12975 [Nocardiopsis gilva YIM 90087]